MSKHHLSQFIYRRKRNPEEGGFYFACYYGKIYVGCYYWSYWMRHTDYDAAPEWNTYASDIFKDQEGEAANEKAARAILERMFLKWLRKIRINPPPEFKKASPLFCKAKRGGSR